MAPALDAISASLDMPTSAPLQKTMLLSIFLLSGAAGPLVFAPLSEAAGRLPVLHASTLLFALANGACAHVRTAGGMLALRCLAGFGSSAVAALASGILADCFE